MKIYVRSAIYVDEVYYACISVKINGKTFDLFYEMEYGINDSWIYDFADSLKAEIRSADGSAPLKELFNAISGAAYTNIEAVEDYEVEDIESKVIDYTPLGTIYIDWDNEECATKEYYRNLYDEYVADGTIDIEDENYDTFDYWFESITHKNGSVSEIKNL